MYELPRVTSQQLANPASSGSNQSSREEALHSMLRCTMDMENSASGAVANLPESCARYNTVRLRRRVRDCLHASPGRTLQADLMQTRQPLGIAENHSLDAAGCE